MTLSSDGGPFFPHDWREQVREILAPFEEEGLPFGSQYRIHIVKEQKEAKPDETSRWQATFQLGEISLELETVSYGMEEETTVIQARKASFKSPLHFWAYAMLIYWPLRDYDGPNSHSHFDFSREQQSRSLSGAEWKKIIEYQWPSKLRSLSDSFTKVYPLPNIIKESVLRAWQNDDRWNEHFMWAETSNSFVLWCWRTCA